MNEVCAAEMICFEQLGNCCAVLAALANDFVSCDSTLALTLLPLHELEPDAPASSLVNAVAYPAVRSAPRIDCMIAPPRSRWRSAVADAMPARRTGTEPVSECEAGVPAKPTPMPTKAYASPTCQYWLSE